MVILALNPGEGRVAIARRSGLPRAAGNTHARRADLYRGRAERAVAVARARYRHLGTGREVARGARR